MSAKWRTLQHRRRYTYSAIVFPSSFTDSLNQSSLTQCCPKFYSDIEEFVSLNSIYAQVNHAKKVVASFGDMYSGRPMKSKARERLFRDCYVAAGVSFCAALQVCLKDEELVLFIAQGIFSWSSAVRFTDIVSKIPFVGDICSEICSFTSLSRLCLIRGTLTAVSRGILVSSFARLSNSDCDRKTILYDRMLPELCDLCENPTDSHLNFHALTVMQICLQQIKTSLLTDLSEDYDPMPDSMAARLLKVIWNNLEDALSQTVKQVHLMFEPLLDIQTTVHKTDDKVGIRESLLEIVKYLLWLGARCKGRYAPLASLTKRLGAKILLDMSPNLLFEMANAYIDDDVCCAVTSFIKCFLEMLRDECWGSEGVDQDYARYREHCLPPFFYGHASGMSKLRSNLNTYAVQVLLERDVDSIVPLLTLISIGPSDEETKLIYTELSNMSIELTVEQKVAVLVSLLKVCRTLAFLEGDIEQKESADAFAFVQIKGTELKVPIEWLEMALTHVAESVRVDAAETLFLNPKTASLPTSLELYLLKEAVLLNMRSSSTGFQMKWTSLFRNFFSRVHTSLEKQYKLGSWKPLLANGNSETY